MISIPFRRCFLTVSNALLSIFCSPFGESVRTIILIAAENVSFNSVLSLMIHSIMLSSYGSVQAEIALAAFFSFFSMFSEFLISLTVVIQLLSPVYFLRQQLNSVVFRMITSANCSLVSSSSSSSSASFLLSFLALDFVEGILLLIETSSDYDLIIFLVAASSSM